MDNKELIQKAQITTDAIAAQGKLNPKQADKFIDYVFDITMLKGKVRTARFSNEKMDIDKINVGSRVAVSKTEATDPQVRRGVSTSKIVLQPREVMVPFEISDDFSQFNIEGGDVEDHIIKMMATQLSNDLEELMLDGDTLGPARYQGDLYDGGSTTAVVKDTYMGLVDGWLKRARQANVKDFAGANVSANVFSQMINTLPEKYKRNKKMLKFFTSTTIEQNYRQTVSSRATQGGDNALNNELNMTPFGIELVGVPLLNTTPRVTEHVILPNAATPVQLQFKNLVSAGEVVALATLGNTPVAPFVEGVNYTMDYVNGTIVKLGAGIADGTMVKITYLTAAQMMLTEYRNLIWAIGRDIRIEKDRDIYKGVNQYAITVKVDGQIENLEAVVFGKNIGTA